MRHLFRLFSLSLLLLTSCVSKSCTEHRGPRAIVGMDEKILSPFPADRLTVPDPTTATGLRVYLPFKDDFTELERTLVQHANTMDGFGTYSPLCVRFDQPIDLSTVTPDTLWLVDITAGAVVPIDLWGGDYPVNLARPVTLFPNEPQHPSLILAPGNSVPFYEEATNCLILRPRVPLKPASRHVVILSRRIHGTNGDPIESPPDEPPTAAEFAAFKKAGEFLNLAAIDVAFYWTFTTHSVSRDLEAVRNGLDRQGSLSWMAERFPAKIAEIKDLKYGLTDFNPYTLEASVASAMFNLLHELAVILQPVYPGLVDLTSTYKPFIANLKNVDYFVFGAIESPNLVEYPDGLWDLDVPGGRARAKPAKVPFMLTIPKPTAENGFAQAPYPVVVHGHGLTVSRLQAWPMADRLAARGLAGACIDLVGHGPMEQFYMIPKLLKSLSPGWQILVKPVVFSLGLLLGVPPNPLEPFSKNVDDVFSSGILAPITGEGRSVDVDGDGNLDPAMGFFSSDFFRMRDNIRQCVVDLMQWARVLRGLGVDRNGNGKLDREEGDVNGDGVCDLGGANAKITYAGVSLGSIIGGIVMGVDPAIETAVLNVAGGGLGDIMFRTTVLSERFVKYVRHDVFGMAIVGRPDGGQVKFTFNEEPLDKAFWSLAASQVAQVDVYNAAKKTWSSAAASKDGAFSVVLAADKGDPIEIVVTGKNGGVATKQFLSPILGLGVSRGSTRSREFLMLLCWFMEPADPICYAPFWWERPLPGVPSKNVLVQLACDDPVVPVASGINLSRAAGLISAQRMSELVSRGVPTGANVAVDVELPPESTKKRAVRFHASGKHAYIIGGNKKKIEDSVKLGLAAQGQMAAFLATAGAVITDDPSFKLVLPDDNGQLLFDIPLPFGISPP